MDLFSFAAGFVAFPVVFIVIAWAVVQVMPADWDVLKPDHNFYVGEEKFHLPSSRESNGPS